MSSGIKHDALCTTSRLKQRLHTFQLQFSVLNQLKLFSLKCLIHVGGFMWSESSPNSGDLVVSYALRKLISVEALRCPSRFGCHHIQRNVNCCCEFYNQELFGSKLLGGFNPSLKNIRQIGNHFPKVRGENKRPPPSKPSLASLFLSSSWTTKSCKILTVGRPEPSTFTAGGFVKQSSTGFSSQKKYKSLDVSCIHTHNCGCNNLLTRGHKTWKVQNTWKEMGGGAQTWRFNWLHLQTLQLHGIGPEFSSGFSYSTGII